MKYKIEYQVENETRLHRRYYTALSASIAKEMFEASKEESLVGVAILENTVKIYHQDKNGKWKG